MKSLLSMIPRMKETGIYELNSDTLIDYELKAYAVGLDMLLDKFEELENESFISTAKGYGLLDKEKMMKLSSLGNIENRQNSIMKLGAITSNSFTKADMENIFIIRGQKAEIYEYPAEKKIYVNFINDNTDNRKKLINTAKMFLPAHLDAELDFRCISWNNIDSRKYTFNKIESFGLSWNNIDNYENKVVKV